MDKMEFHAEYGMLTSCKLLINRLQDLQHIDELQPKQININPYEWDFHQGLFDLRKVTHIRCVIYNDQEFEGYTKPDMSDRIRVWITDDNVLHIINDNTGIKWSLILMALGVVGKEVFTYN